MLTQMVISVGGQWVQLTELGARVSHLAGRRQSPASCAARAWAGRPDVPVLPAVPVPPAVPVLEGSEWLKPQLFPSVRMSVPGVLG